MVIENLEFSYHNEKILSNISFPVNQGEVCGLLGPNGSGKTTLLKCMNGVLRHNAGDIRIQNRRLSEMSRSEIAKWIAMVPQELKVVFSFTVQQIVLMGGSGRFGMAGIPKTQDREQADAVLEELNIGRLAHRRFNELSGGEKQMVLIARALFQKADILLLDEPISHLDFKRQHMIMELIRRITRERNLAILITLHDPNIAGRYCDRLIMLNKGRIFHQGARDDIFHAKSLESVYDMPIRIERTGIGTPFALPDNDP
jgi:iron complex transport system ATP-binding protein